MTTKDSQQSLNRRQLAQRFGVHVETIKRWERAGKLTPVRFGQRTIRYPIDYVLKVEKEGLPN